MSMQLSRRARPQRGNDILQDDISAVNIAPFAGRLQNEKQASKNPVEIAVGAACFLLVENGWY